MGFIELVGYFTILIIIGLAVGFASYVATRAILTLLDDHYQNSLRAYRTESVRYYTGVMGRHGRKGILRHVEVVKKENSKCYAKQTSDQMTCPCGNVWDINDPDRPKCQ